MIARAFVVLGPTLFGALPAAAQTVHEAMLLPRLIDTGCFELVDEINGCEQVTLLTSETEPDTADLLIYPDRRTDEADGPLLVVRGVAYDGAMWGMAPSLEHAPGGFRLASEQSGIGRFPWFQSIGVAHDGQAFIVTDYTYSAYDRAWPRYMTCTVDFTSGAYQTGAERGDPENENADPVVTEATGTIEARRVLLRDWRMMTALPPICQEAVDAAFAD